MDRYHREPTLAEVLSDPVTLAVMAADRVDPQELPYSDFNARANCMSTWTRMPENQNARAILLASGPAHSSQRYRFIASAKGQAMLRVASRWCAARGH